MGNFTPSASLPPFDDTVWLQMALRNPGGNVVLPPEDKETYFEIEYLLLNRRFSSPELLRKTVFNSDDYGYSFKHKLALKVFHPEGNLWAFKNLNLEDLFVFLATDYYHSEFRQKGFPDETITKDELEALADNPSFLQSLGTEHDSLRLIFFIFLQDLNPDGLIPLVNRLIQRHQMSFVIASELLKDICDDFKLLDYAVDTYEVVNLLADWVAEQYGLEKLPAQWILKFMHSTLSDSEVKFLT